MRRNAPLQSQTSEPLIVVEESGNQDNEGTKEETYSPSSEEESPTMNPYLLSPWRDARETRKHSLPTPQCSGITASQVRRLSERGDGSSGPTPRQAEFLATLSTAPAPVPGGRRHSVVTISKVPTTLFGRNRRESVSAYPSGPGRVLGSRRESITGPPSTEPRGSVHNLQLDIMDDIVQARKVRMKLWNTSNEKVCEVQPLDDAGAGGGVQRYTNSSGRRYSDFVGTTLAPIPSSSSKRRASELPPPSSPCSSTSASKQPTSGIICSNTDLISILSSLTSSATEINQCDYPSMKTDCSKLTTEQRRSRLKTNRSNSFDISILHGTGNKIQTQDTKSTEPGPSNWFVKRHQPMSSKSDSTQEKKQVRVTFACENPKNDIRNEYIHKDHTHSEYSHKVYTPTKDYTPTKEYGHEQEMKMSTEEANKVVWDGRSGSLIDAELLGNAIEVFLRRAGTSEQQEPQTAAPPLVRSQSGSQKMTSLKGLTQKVPSLKVSSQKVPSPKGLTQKLPSLKVSSQKVPAQKGSPQAMSPHVMSPQIVSPQTASSQMISSQLISPQMVPPQMVPPQTVPPSVSPNRGAIPKITVNKGPASKQKSSWFSSKGDEDSSTETCDSSLCSTLKDLFVK